MKHSCSYCGKIHAVNMQCPAKPKRVDKKEITQADRFRWSKPWKKKSLDIKERDNHLCQICIRRLYNTVGLQFNHKNTSVHHIEPLQERYDLRLDDENLVTCCAYHHAMADNGRIPRGELHDIAREQNEKR